MFVYEYDLQIVHFQVFDVFKCCDIRRKDNNIKSSSHRLINWTLVQIFLSPRHDSQNWSIPWRRSGGGGKYILTFGQTTVNIRECVRSWISNVLSYICVWLIFPNKLPKYALKRKLLVELNWTESRELSLLVVKKFQTAWSLFVHEFSVNCARAHSGTDSSYTYKCLYNPK